MSQGARSRTVEAICARKGHEGFGFSGAENSYCSRSAAASTRPIVSSASAVTRTGATKTDALAATFEEGKRQFAEAWEAFKAWRPS